MLIKDIEGYEELYAITNTGKVWSYPKKVGITQRKGTWLKANTDGSGYLFVGLTNSEGIKKQPKVNRLVALAFIANPFNLPQVNHKDGNKLNNNDWNLEWSTASNNIKHAFALGLSNQKGEKNAGAILTDLKILEIRKLHSNKTSQRQIAIKYKVHPVTIHNIIHNKTWTHVKNIQRDN